MTRMPRPPRSLPLATGQPWPWPAARHTDQVAADGMARGARDERRAGCVCARGIHGSCAGRGLSTIRESAPARTRPVAGMASEPAEAPTRLARMRSKTRALAGRRIAITGAAPREELRHGPDGGRP